MQERSGAPTPKSGSPKRKRTTTPLSRRASFFGTRVTISRFWTWLTTPARLFHRVARCQFPSRSRIRAISRSRRCRSRCFCRAIRLSTRGDLRTCTTTAEVNLDVGAQGVIPLNCTAPRLRGSFYVGAVLSPAWTLPARSEWASICRRTASSTRTPTFALCPSRLSPRWTCLPCLKCVPLCTDDHARRHWLFGRHVP
jgi:hypothetical protein